MRRGMTFRATSLYPWCLIARCLSAGSLGGFVAWVTPSLASLLSDSLNCSRVLAQMIARWLDGFVGKLLGWSHGCVTV
jgi:hypothetical protein